jgi:hypothetical protein
LTRLLACLAAAVLLASPGQAQERRGPPDGGERGGPGGGPRRQPYANPSAAIAAELAFARLAQEKGQWTAFIATSTPEAEMFVPQRVLAQAWLKKRPNPPAALKWTPHAVWASCDGTTAVTQGAWQGPGGGQGIFTTVWQRQPKKGDYRWVLDIGSTLAKAPEAPDIIPALVATCDGADLPVTPDQPPQPGDDSKTAVSRDGSLRWTSTVRADGSRHFTLTMRSADGPKRVIELTARVDQ